MITAPAMRMAADNGFISDEWMRAFHHTSVFDACERWE